MRRRTLYITALLATIFLVLLLAATLATRGTRASPGTTLYVSTDPNCAGHDPCYTNVQDALDAATTDDQILVATGVYTDPAGTVAEITETITLRGGWNANFTIPQPDPEAYPTTLDAQGSGRVIEITGNISPTIDGFIITGGNADTEALDAGRGGGIYSKFAAPIIQNNVITDNIANTANVGYGGGLYLVYASASALINNNQILSNTASTSNVGQGGGLYLLYSEATLIGNAINNNTASTVSGGAGGGLAVKVSEATLDSNRIISNTAPGAGGGLHVSGSAPFTLTNNIIAQNETNGVAGGIFFSGALDFPTTGALINNTIAQNKGGSGEGVYASGTTTLTLTNNIVVSHTYGIYVSGSATVTADYTLFFGNTSGATYGTIVNNNPVSGNPLFVGPSAWDYHIQVASPAVNKGTFTGAPATDFEGDARPYDCFIDIGADENTASDYCKRIYLPLILKNY
ncbi:MAG: right-handed parallel beta-helix repeat-containing protein [Anaerolineae bacterium]|nr:right-handed parallel beta-helix repeat-containing protein [Anaerolineae bacterium]